MSLAKLVHQGSLLPQTRTTALPVWRRPTFSPERVANGAEAQHHVQVVPHPLNQVGKEAVLAFLNAFQPSPINDMVLDLEAGRG